MKQTNALTIVALVFVLGLTACDSRAGTTSVVPTPISVIPTATPLPSPTWTPTVTLSPVPTKTPTATPTPRPATTPCPIPTPGGPTGQIIFSAVKCYNEACQPFDGDVAPIYLINSDGSGIRQIYEGIGVIGDLQLSPDSTKLAFTDNYGHGMSNVYGLDLASGDAWSLAADDISQRSWGARWVSDDRLVYVSRATDPANSPSNIYLTNVTGTWHQSLTNRSDDRTHIGNIAISPDSSQLLFAEFVHDPNTTTVIYQMNSDGSRIEELVIFPGMPNAYARWSPTGDWLIAYANPMGYAEHASVYRAESDSSNIKKIIDLPGRDSLDLLNWTEDGLLFYVCNHLLEISQIVVVQSNGSVHTLANVEISDTPLDTTWCVFGSLSPDRQLFAFAPFLPFGARNLYVTDMLSDDCSYQILSGYSIQSMVWLSNQAVP